MRWVAAAAHTGPGSLTLWLFAALFFFVPSALVVTRLAEKFPEEGGMYVWVKRAFGDGHAFLCSWLYFISSILYFPSLLLAGVSMGAYVFGSHGSFLAESGGYALPTTLAVLWGLMAANFFGLRFAKWILIIGGSATFVICAVLVTLAFITGAH